MVLRGEQIRFPPPTSTPPIGPRTLSWETILASGSTPFPPSSRHAPCTKTAAQQVWRSQPGPCKHGHGWDQHQPPPDRPRSSLGSGSSTNLYAKNRVDLRSNNLQNLPVLFQHSNREHLFLKTHLHFRTQTSELKQISYMTNINWLDFVSV